MITYILISLAFRNSSPPRPNQNFFCFLFWGNCSFCSKIILNLLNGFKFCFASLTFCTLVGTSVARVVGPSVTTSSTPFSFETLVFWNFQWQKSLKYQCHILNPNPTKSIPLNLAHEDLSNNIKATFQFLQIFQLQFNLIFSEEIIPYSRTFAPQVQMSWNQSLCTHPRQELAKDTKNTI